MVEGTAVRFLAIPELATKTGFHCGSEETNPWRLAEAHGEVRFAAS